VYIALVIRIVSVLLTGIIPPLEFVANTDNHLTSCEVICVVIQFEIVLQTETCWLLVRGRAKMPSIIVPRSPSW
jgi:hypothetical protein